VEDKVWGKAEVKVRGEEWVKAGQARARAGNAFVRSVERERRISAGFRVLSIPAPSAGQR